MLLDLEDVIAFATPVVVSSLALAAAHWFPWHGGTKVIQRTTAYAIGTAIVVGVPVGAMLLSELLGEHYPTLFWAALLVVNACVGGATVMVAYAIDSRRAVTREDIDHAA